MKTRISIFHSRAFLKANVLNNAAWFGCLFVGTLVLGSGSVQAGTWTGATSTDWNNNSNWSGGNSGTDQVNLIAGNIATISADFTTIPTSIIVGNTVAGRVNHVSGNASVASGNDLVIGRTAGGIGTYNLANTAAVGGSLTDLGQGSGNLTIPDQVWVGGSVSSATGSTSGVLNIHTTGTLSVGTQLLVGSFGGTGTVKMDSGTLTVADVIEIGNGPSSVGATSTGTFSMSGGTVTKTGAGSAVTIGGGATTDGGTGTANLNGGTFTTAGTFRVGQDTISTTATNSNGTLNLGGTNLTVGGEFWIGNNTGATGVMNFSSGSLTTNNWSLVGRKDDTNTGTGATGTVTMTGGTWTKIGESNFVVGDTGPGTMNMSGGLVIVTPHATADRGITWVGNRNSTTGTLTISGTAEFRSSRFMMAVQTGTTGTLNLNGGTVKTTSFSGGIGTSNINFNGTQIIATGSSTAFLDGLTSANLGTGGLLVNTAGFDLSGSQALAGSGGIVKTGTGSLTLTGAGTYTGTNTITAGKLVLSTTATGAGSVSVASGATFGVNQSDSTSFLAVPSVTAGTASINIGLAEGFGNTTVAPLKVNGTLTLNGTVTINVADLQPDVGTVPLVSYVGSKAGSGGFVLGKLPLGVTATLTDNGTGLVSLNVTAVSFPVWRGNVSGNWDTTTLNWVDQSSLDPLLYKDPLSVIFDDTATGSTTLTLNIPVSPANVAFNNETTPYSLSGSGKITDSTGLTKSGSAALAINNSTNDYTGATTLSGGTTTVGFLSNGGLASSLGAASASSSNLVLGGGTLEYTGGNVTIDRGFSLNGFGGGISTANDLTISGVVDAPGGGNLRKTGAGLLSLTNPTVTLGGTGQINEVQGGTLAFQGPGQTVSIPGQIYVGSVPNVPANLVIQNSSLTVGTFIALGRGNGDTGTVSSLTATNSTVQIGSFSTGFDNALATNDSDQTVTLTNTNWTTTGATLLAEKQNSTTNMTIGGTSVYTGNANLQMAIDKTAVCNVTVQDTAKIVHTGGWFSVGNTGVGVLTMKGSSSVSTNVDFNMGDVGTSNGTLNIQDSATVTTTGTTFVGKNTGTTGAVNMTGGTYNATAYITIGRYVGAIGHFNISGGTLNQTGNGIGFNVGENGTGTLTVSGTGVLNLNSDGLYLSAEGTGTSDSRAYLNGGTIIAKRVIQRNFNASNYTEFHFNGGILRAQPGAFADFMSNHDLVTVDAGGAFIDSNGQIIAISQALGGTGSLTKQGTGTLTLSGANSYTGNTTVSAGTLSLGTAYLANTATVTIAAGAVLNLTHGATDQVGALIIGGVSQPAGTYDATTNPGVITGTGKLQVTGGVASPYDTWIAGYPSIAAGDRGPAADPDNDGYNNAAEFALGGIPNSASDRPKIYTIIADGSVDADTNKELLMTIAVRSGTPAFSGTQSPTALKDGYNYTVQGSTDLVGFTAGVTEVAPVITGLPAAPLGYEYRTFSLDGSNNLPTKGFLRVKVNP